MQFVKIMSGVLLTVLCWGMYGPVLHKGQMYMASGRLRPFICVGLAYLALAVIMPAIILGSQGELTQGWKFKGVTWSLIAGTAGALGALGIVIALASGGKPVFVMPLVFGCAPVVSVFLSMKLTKTEAPSPAFYAGLILVSMGAGMVMFFQPKSPAPPGGADKPAVVDRGPLDVQDPS